MPAAQHDLIIEKSATFKRKLVWRDKSKKPINLTGYAAKMQVRSAAGAVDVLLELSTVNGRIVLGTVNGSITLVVTAAVTSLVTWTSGVYDLKLVAPDGTETRLIEGNITVSAGVTE